MKYIPDTFDYELIKERFGTQEIFLNMQVKYKRGLEAILLNYLDMAKIQKVFLSMNINVPPIQDQHSNFYKLYSMLDNPYLYIRNNYHVEALSDEELVTLNSSPTTTFFSKTYEKVMFEQGDTVFYGTPEPGVQAPSKSITFEMAYNLAKCENIDQIKSIKSLFKIWQDIIEKNMQQAGLDVSFVVYEGVPIMFEIDK